MKGYSKTDKTPINTSSRWEKGGGLSSLPVPILWGKMLWLKDVAFTLAEVLIVISIVGMIADMTTPTLVSSYQEKVTVTKLKKIYSTLEQAYRLATIENGMPETWDIDPRGNGTGVGAMKLMEIFLPYLKVSKVCGLETGCFGLAYENLQGEATPYQPNSYYTYAKIMLVNGYSILFWSAGSGCNDESIAGRCGSIRVDINGIAGPNQYGKDVFNFNIFNNKVAPANFAIEPHPSIDCDRNSTKVENGLSCTWWVIYKENMDYLRRDISLDE